MTTTLSEKLGGTWVRNIVWLLLVLIPICGTAYVMDYRVGEVEEDVEVQKNEHVQFEKDIRVVLGEMKDTLGEIKGDQKVLLVKLQFQKEQLDRLEQR